MLGVSKMLVKMVSPLFCNREIFVRTWHFNFIIFVGTNGTLCWTHCLIFLAKVTSFLFLSEILLFAKSLFRPLKQQRTDRCSSEIFPFAKSLSRPLKQQTGVLFSNVFPCSGMYLKQNWKYFVIFKNWSIVYRRSLNIGYRSHSMCIVHTACNLLHFMANCTDLLLLVKLHLDKNKLFHKFNLCFH